MRAVHIFNSSSISGPEALVIPALKHAPWKTEVWSLREARRGEARPLEEYCEQYGLRVKSFEVNARLDFKAIKKMKSNIESLEGNVIFHSHDAKASIYTWAALAGERRKNCRSIVTHHGAMARPDTLSRFYERIFTYGTKWFADSVLCVCNSDFELLLNRGVPENKLQLHLNGITRPTLTWDARRSNTFHGEKKWAIVGRLSPEKNHSRLLEVLSHLQILSSLPWSLDILGDGALRMELQKQSEKLGVHKKVNFLGYKDEVWKDFDKYDCLINFSHGEGIPISLLEAGWRTTPVFASAVGGIPELCGANGAELFELKENNEELALKLLNYSNDNHKRRNRAEMLNQRVKDRFSEGEWLARLEKIYQAAFGQWQ